MQFCTSTQMACTFLRRCLLFSYSLPHSFSRPQRFGGGLGGGARIGNHHVSFFPHSAGPEAGHAPCLVHPLTRVSLPVTTIPSAHPHRHAHTSTSGPSVLHKVEPDVFIFQGKLLLQAFSLPFDFQVGSILCRYFKYYCCTVWCYFFPPVFWTKTKFPETLNA